MFSRWFAPLVFAGDEEKTRQAALLQMAVIVAGLYVSALLLLGLLGYGSKLYLFANGLAWANAILMYFLLRRGNISLVGSIVAVTSFIWITLLIIDRGTILTSETAAYALIVLGAGQFFGWYGVIAASVASALAIMFILLAEYAGLLTPAGAMPGLYDWFLYLGIIGLTGGLALYINRVTQKALQDTRQEVAERQRAEQRLLAASAALQQQNAYLALLHEITLDLLNRRDLDELLHAVIERAIRLLDAPYAELMLVKDGRLVVQTTSQNQQTIIGESVGRDQARLSWQAYDTRQPVTLDDYSTYPYRREIYAAYELHAVADFPVLVRDACIGVLALGRSEPGYVFSEKQIQDGMLFSQLIALVLDNAQILASAQHEIGVRTQTEAELRAANQQLDLRMQKIEQLHDELRQQALIDPLTGLYNRRYLADILQREVARARRENDHVSIIILDIDHFKRINDTYGHAAGDSFLTGLAAMLKNTLRQSDVVCRYGGEEFLVVMPGATLMEAARRAEELRQKCTAISIHFDRHDLCCSTSFGVAAYPDHDQDPEQIIIKADRALYHSKRSGRNRVTVWEERISMQADDNDTIISEPASR